LDLSDVERLAYFSLLIFTTIRPTLDDLICAILKQISKAVEPMTYKVTISN
jgi:hypothetical protein